MPRSTRTQLARIDRANTAALVREDEDRIAQKALELRRQGKSFFEIAERLGVSESQVASLAHRAISSAAALVSQATRAEILALEVSRLDAALDAIWEDAMAGDISAARELRGNVMDRAKLLGLLDGVPQTATTQTVIITGESEEYRRALQAISQGTAG